ncbi:MAG: helix-turn-helix transcriptional regulator [Myxococcales bacterium]|nr:helix-turn-helix transcriptional regulator [Myxococcales bacterium]
MNDLGHVPHADVSTPPASPPRREVAAALPSLALRIDEARRAAGLDLYRLAIKARLGQSTMRLAARGVATQRTIEKLSRALGLTVEQLAGSTHG